MNVSNTFSDSWSCNISFELIWLVSLERFLSSLLTCPAVVACEARTYPWRSPVVAWWLRARRSPRWTPGSASHPVLYRSASRSSSGAHQRGRGASSPLRLPGRPRHPHYRSSQHTHQVSALPRVGKGCSWSCYLMNIMKGDRVRFGSGCYSMTTCLIWSCW